MNAALETPVTEAPSESVQTCEGEKLLLVDDEPTTQQTLTRLLAGEGYKLVVASNGSEAIEFAGNADFDLALLDLNMPGVNNWDTFDRLTSENPLLPVIVITASPNQRFIALAAGTPALMEKPLDLQKLMLMIRNLLGEPEDVRIARMAGRPTEFHFVPPMVQGPEPDEITNLWRNH